MRVDPSGHLAELAARGLLPEDHRAVYLAGSLVRGWGNSGSDLDVYVVSAAPRTAPSTALAPVALTPDHVPVEVVHVDGVRWDIEYWTDSQVDQMFAKVSWEEFDTNHSVADLLTSHEMDFLERLGSAVSVTGEEWLAGRRTQLESSAIRSILVSRALNLSDLFVEDAVGQLKAGDVESAVLSAKLAFGYAVNALHVSCGEFGHSAKWRARRFRQVEQTIMPFEEYWAIETMRGYDPANPAAWVEDVVLACRRISMEVVI
ncbi:hypothetical protein ACFQ08_09630 [Streptosporangium algeriense]|uniref:Polymerase nucleotidyl transferase domain-containing protein n=1 Tax=Streptosporangium algeriense TaxID=1682748 RepID=A0ABW3DP41_9ACTN